jgi:hypothetical protein
MSIDEKQKLTMEDAGETLSDTDGDIIGSRTQTAENHARTRLTTKDAKRYSQGRKHQRSSTQNA